MDKRNLYLDEPNNEVIDFAKKFILIILGIVFFIGAIYLVFKLQELSENKGIKEEIQYEKILAKNILSQKEDNYFVLVYDIKNDKTYNNQITQFRLSNSLYVVDSKLMLNKEFFRKENPVLKVNNIKELKITETTLLEVKNKAIINYYLKDDISDRLNN